jgi:hypothetical protein
MDRADMLTVSVVRLASEAPRIGADIDYDHGGQRFHGRVVAHRALHKAKRHVHVIVQVTPQDHKRMMLGDRD